MIWYSVPLVKLALSHRETYGSWGTSVTLLIGGFYRPLLVLAFVGSVHYLVRRRLAKSPEEAAQHAWLGPLLAGALYGSYALLRVELLGGLWILMVPVALVLDVTTLVLLGRGLVRAFGSPTSRALRRGVLCGVLAVFAIAWQHETIGYYSYFLRHKSSYEQTLAALQANPSEKERGMLDGTEYVLDDGRPMRVAFPWPGGIIDNWTGVVWDPTGLVMDSSRFERDWSNWDDPSLGPAKSLFGGDMTNAIHLFGPWHLCFFT